MWNMTTLASWAAIFLVLLIRFWIHFSRLNWRLHNFLRNERKRRRSTHRSIFRLVESHAFGIQLHYHIIFLQELHVVLVHHTIFINATNRSSLDDHVVVSQNHCLMKRIVLHSQESSCVGTTAPCLPRLGRVQLQHHTISNLRHPTRQLLPQLLFSVDHRRMLHSW